MIDKSKLPYIQMFSVHGLLRAHDMELGRNADTGGQINYVVELGRHLSMRDDIGKVDIFTRLIADKTVSPDYAEPIEVVSDKLRIIRIKCGGRKYIRKELLWPHLDEYIDNTIRFIKQENTIPDLVHGHYADAGYVAGRLADFLGLPFVYTGHSLGQAKFNKLLNESMTKEDIIKKYKINRRIEVEEEILLHADTIITSTQHEIKEQYGLYNNKDAPTYQVIPPGIDIAKFYPFYHDMFEDKARAESARYAQASMHKELTRFFSSPDKPLILALCRPDKRKNISGLIQAYGEDLELRAMANLAIFAGLRKDIDEMEENERDVLTNMLLLMDKYDLYGKLAIPKRHDFEFEVPALYRIAADKHGVFINPALTEPFGLTLLEASATGLPIVATNDGGPNDIVANCENGILIDAKNTKDISSALKRILANEDVWQGFSKNGILNVRKHYTWESHAQSYAKTAVKLIAENVASNMQSVSKEIIGRKLFGVSEFLIVDIDNTLLGKDNSSLDELMSIIRKRSKSVGFGVATGRSIESALEILGEHNVVTPDVIISSVGSEIYYGAKRKPGIGWETHISCQWNREKIYDVLKELDFLTYQEDESQRPFKVSYYLEPNPDHLAKVQELLVRNKCKHNLIYSHDRFLDILPYRASKGKAIRYLSYQLNVSLNHFFVCGDSGNDEEMLRGEPRAIVVGNYSSELEPLKESRHVYFADRPCAGGIIEGLNHYNFIES